MAPRRWQQHTRTVARTFTNPDIYLRADKVGVSSRRTAIAVGALAATTTVRAFAVTGGAGGEGMFCLGGAGHLWEDAAAGVDEPVGYLLVGEVSDLFIGGIYLNPLNV